MKTKLSPKNMKSYIKLCICASTLFVFGCTHLEKKEENSTISMKKKMDELSQTISYIVNDGNNLHSEMEAIRSGNQLLDRRIDELTRLVKSINQQLESLKIEVKTAGNFSPANEKPEMSSETIPPHNDVISEKEETAPQKHNVKLEENPREVAEKFWKALNAKDLETAKTYVTKASKKSLMLNDASSENEESVNKLTFGSTEIKDGKAIIPTTMNTLTGETNVEVPLQTVLVQEDGNWKVDANETMMSIFGGAMGQIMEGLGETMQQGMKKMGKAMAEGLKQGMEEMTNTDAKEVIKNNKPKTDTESFSGEGQ